MNEKPEILDFSKPFFYVYKEGEDIVTETNLPNDTIGDFAFEYDFDGTQRKKWEEYLAELDKKGTRGQLVYHITRMKYNGDLDEEKSYPLESYKFIIMDITKDN